jgi:Tfp pilus assembly protein PilV
MISGHAAATWRRRAFTMVEVAITSLLLVIAMTVTLQVLGWVASERRAVDRRQYAIHEAANLMERLAARPWDQLTTGAVKDLALSELARQTLPGAELSVAAEETGEPIGAKRLSVRLRWRNRAGGWEAPVRLSAWTYRPGEKP